MGPEEPGTGVVPKQGSLYLLGSDGLDAKVTEVDVSNGLAWNANATLMYYVDTGTGRVDVFDYDNDFGVISKKLAHILLRDLEKCQLCANRVVRLFKKSLT
jgi:sugar lactone lactonase YvrE